jgi:hypothetical protein
VELEGRQPIINNPPHLIQHAKRILGKVPFWLTQRKKMVREYE